MSRRQAERGRRRLNHYAERRIGAGPLALAIIAFDEWRATLNTADPADRDRLARVMEAQLQAQIQEIRRCSV